MKPVVYLTAFLFILIACKTKTPESESEIVLPDAEELVTYNFKVVGLQDTVIRDSIWRMIFKVQGIDQILISHEDSGVVIRAVPEVKESDLVEEIISRGGEVLN